MLNLMVILIPVLLTSSEFVKVGAIELKLPTAAQAGAGAGGGASIGQSAKLDLGIVITTKGFNVFSYFKAENQAATMASMHGTQPDIPLVGTKYDFAALNNKLMEIKKKALLQIIVSSYAGVTDQTSLLELYKSYMSKDFSNVQLFADHECVKIIADDKITYETVVGCHGCCPRGICRRQSCNHVPERYNCRRNNTIMPARQSVRRQTRKRGNATVKLNITSMIDMFTLMVVFLPSELFCSGAACNTCRRASASYIVG